MRSSAFALVDHVVRQSSINYGDICRVLQLLEKSDNAIKEAIERLAYHLLKPNRENIVVLQLSVTLLEILVQKLGARAIAVFNDMMISALYVRVRTPSWGSQRPLLNVAISRSKCFWNSQVENFFRPDIIVGEYKDISNYSSTPNAIKLALRQKVLELIELWTQAYLMVPQSGLLKLRSLYGELRKMNAPFPAFNPMALRNIPGGVQSLLYQAHLAPPDEKQGKLDELEKMVTKQCANDGSIYDSNTNTVNTNFNEEMDLLFLSDREETDTQDKLYNDNSTYEITENQEQPSSPEIQITNDISVFDLKKKKNSDQSGWEIDLTPYPRQTISKPVANMKSVVAFCSDTISTLLLDSITGYQLRIPRTGPINTSNGYMGDGTGSAAGARQEIKRAFKNSRVTNKPLNNAEFTSNVENSAAIVNQSKDDTQSMNKKSKGSNQSWKDYLAFGKKQAEKNSLLFKNILT